mmetsp:Transcript_7363/g.15896  ORF Transcript_7363/g.15896 Transcript_7363/m.15896 type:complete len:251 (-) Transcript_7363:142-894(-)
MFPAQQMDSRPQGSSIAASAATQDLHQWDMFLGACHVMFPRPAREAVALSDASGCRLALAFQAARSRQMHRVSCGFGETHAPAQVALGWHRIQQGFLRHRRIHAFLPTSPRARIRRLGHGFPGALLQSVQTAPDVAFRRLAGIDAPLPCLAPRRSGRGLGYTGLCPSALIPLVQSSLGALHSSALNLQDERWHRLFRQHVMPAEPHLRLQRAGCSGILLLSGPPVRQLHHFRSQAFRPLAPIPEMPRRFD